ncbi:MAG: DUF512 domain-containing protein [Symbiobacteriia bacterium]
MSQRKEPRAVIARVESSSPADRLGIEPGDVLVAINGRPLTDVLEYRFQMAGDRAQLDVLKPDGRRLELEANLAFDEDFGLDFDDPLFDQVYTCDNNCVFCFVHQSPSKMRRSLYIMDDDYRLSFWNGYFVTLTNLREGDLDRIIQQGMTPLNVSVHATEDDLREFLMGTPKARGVLPVLRKLIDAGIQVNTQLVLSPGINDGEHLDRSIADLADLYPGVLTISAVPVGLTRHRERLHPLQPYTAASAARTLAQIQAWQERLLARLGTRLVFPADEFYTKAHEPVPPAAAYEGFPQLENGVGLLRKLLDEVDRTLPLLPARLPAPRRVTAVTGVSASATVAGIVAQLNRIHGLQVDLLVVENEYYGHSVTITGLLTGQDITAALQQRDLGESVFLPEVMLREGEGQRVTLDGWDLERIAGALGRPVERLSRNGAEALAQLCGVQLQERVRIPAPHSALAQARSRRRSRN